MKSTHFSRPRKVIALSLVGSLLVASYSFAQVWDSEDENASLPEKPASALGSEARAAAPQATAARAAAATPTPTARLTWGANKRIMVDARSASDVRISWVGLRVEQSSGGGAVESRKASRGFWGGGTGQSSPRLAYYNIYRDGRRMQIVPGSQTNYTFPSTSPFVRGERTPIRVEAVDTGGRETTDGPRVDVVVGDGSPSTPGSCRDACGGMSGACYCDDTCSTNGDCCPDYGASCAPLYEATFEYSPGGRIDAVRMQGNISQ